jgi:hypothetical protein
MGANIESAKDPDAARIKIAVTMSASGARGRALAGPVLGYAPDCYVRVGQWPRRASVLHRLIRLGGEFVRPHVLARFEPPFRSASFHVLRTVSRIAGGHCVYARARGQPGAITGLPPRAGPTS